LADDDFRAARFDIHWLDRRLAAGELLPPDLTSGSDLPILAAAIAHHARAHRTAAVPEGPQHRARWRDAARHEARRSPIR
jgi:hypothetical protein